MLKIIIATAIDRARLAEITGVLLRHGLHDVLAFFGLTRTNRSRNKADIVEESEHLPQRLVLALEELGPTFVKLGQILASRTDLLPAEWTQALSQLQSRAAPLAWKTLEPQVVADLGAQPQDVFAWFDEQPFASASIAQIHRARLQSGEDVIVKIQRPGLEKTMRADLRLLRLLAETVSNQIPELARFQPVQLITNLEVALMQELDFCYEAANCEAMRASFADNAQIVIPQIFEQWTTPRLMVQEFLDGTQPENPVQMEAAGFDGRVLAITGATAFLHMVLEARLYHADPHPGNVMALSGNRVGFIDFGMVGHLTEQRRDEVLSLLYALSESDSQALVNVLIMWCMPSDVTLKQLEQATAYFLEKQGSLPLQLGKALTDMLATARQFSLPIPADLVLLFKALITADGVLNRLDPQFDLIATLEPMVHKLVLKRYSVKAGKRNLQRLTAELLDIGSNLPQTMRLVLQRIRSGKLKAEITVNNVDKLGLSFERGAVTLVLGLVLVALILVIGPWLLSIDFSIFGVPVLPTLGSLAMVFVALWLFWRFRGR